jgi:hypothetical protein
VVSQRKEERLKRLKSRKGSRETDITKRVHERGIAQKNGKEHKIVEDSGKNTSPCHYQAIYWCTAPT